MSDLSGSNRLVKVLSQLPVFQTHFAWGPVNSVVLLLGVGLLTAAANASGALPENGGIAIGMATIFLLVTLQLRQRWDQELGGLLLVAIAFALYFEGYNLVPLMLGLGLVVLVATSFQVANQWDKTVLLRLGRFPWLS